jgi:short-subunit dehydrogenase
MGREVAKLLAKDGYVVGLSARRLHLLKKIQEEISTTTYIKQIDVSKPDEAVKKLEEMTLEIGGLDLIVLSGTGFREVDWTSRDWTADKSVFDVDILGFYALARTALNFFEKQGHGHLVGFTSVDGLRGVADCPAYSAAKAFCSRYMEADRNRCAQKNLSITITDIIPGWINSQEDPEYKKKALKAYWVDSLQDASQEIFLAIKNKVPVAHITKRWQQVAEVLKTMPDELYNALGGL